MWRVIYCTASSTDIPPIPPPTCKQIIFFCLKVLKTLLLFALQRPCLKSAVSSNYWWTFQSIHNWIGHRTKFQRFVFFFGGGDIQGTGCGKKMMFMASEETFGSQRSLRGVLPSEKLRSLQKDTQTRSINTRRGEMLHACLNQLWLIISLIVP